MFTPQPFARRYLLLDKIATGGMAEVYKAKSYGVEGFEKLVVIKRILPHLSGNARFVSMFINEAKIAVSLNHGNIVQVFTLGKYAEDYFIAMEYVHGRDLMQVLKVCRQRGIPVPVPLVLYIVAEVARGLDYAHRKHDLAGNPLQIIHRDISPHNVVLSFEGEVKIVDFGIARIASQIMEEGQKGRLGGKFAYMSPEQASGQPMDARSDLFSLGLVCYELLTGQKAYQGKGLAEKLERVRHGEFPPPRALRPDMSDGLETILLKTLAVRPEDRYQSAGDLYEDLTELMFASGGVVTAQTLGAFVRDLFQEDLAAEQKGSGLKAVVGSLERMERDFDEPRSGITFTGQSSIAPTGDGGPAVVDPERTSPPVEPALLAPQACARRNLLVLLAEPIGLTEISLKLPDDRYLELVADLVKRFQHTAAVHGGVVESYVHDRLCVLWGQRRAQEDDPERALACALNLQAASAAVGQAHGHDLVLNVAVNRGPALVSATEGQLRFTALGDTLKLTERLLLHCQPGEIVVSDAIREPCEAGFHISSRESVPAPWAQKPIPAFSVTGARSSLERARTDRDVARIARRTDRWFPRRDELEVLAAALSAVDERRGQVVGLTGEAGIGKTRLVGEVGRLVLNRNVGWQVGRCHFRDRETPLAVFRDMIAAGCRIDAHDPRDVIREKLSSLLELGLQPYDLQFIGGLFTVPDERQNAPAGEAPESQEGIFRALHRLLRGMSADRPMLFVFDNVQWMDPVSIKLLGELIDHARELPLLVLMAYRTGYRPPFADGPGYLEIVLERLNRERTIEMAQTLLGVERLPASLGDDLYKRSDGNPLFLEQLVKLLREAGHLVVEQGEVHITSLPAAQVPPTLQGLIESRVDSLSELGREILQILSVVGRQAFRAVIREAMQLEVDLEPILMELSARDLVSLIDDQIAFKNHLTWEVAYHSIPHRVLKEYHRQVGQALEELYAGELARNAEELYHHFEAAGDLVRAARYASLAGERYRKEDFTSKAVDFYTKAIDLLRSCSGDGIEEEQLLREMANLCLKAGGLQWVIGDRATAEATLERGLDLAGELEDDELEAQLLLELGQLRADKGDRFLAQSYLEHALELAEALEAHELCCAVLDTLGAFYLEGGETAAAGRVFDKGLALARQVDRPLALSQLMLGKGTYLFHLGEYEEALERFNRALSLAEEAGDRILCGRILNNIGNTYNFMGLFEEAMEAYRRSGEIHKGVGFMRGAITNLHNIGDLYFRQERLAKAYAYFLESRNMARDYRWSRGEASNMVYMGYIEAVKGDPDAGLKTLRDGIGLASKSGHPDSVATGHWLEGLYFARKQPELARSGLQKGLAIARTLGQRKLEEEICKALGELA